MNECVNERPRTPPSLPYPSTNYRIHTNHYPPNRPSKKNHPPKPASDPDLQPHKRTKGRAKKTEEPDEEPKYTKGYHFKSTTSTSKNEAKQMMHTEEGEGVGEDAHGVHGSGLLPSPVHRIIPQNRRRDHTRIHRSSLSHSFRIMPIPTPCTPTHSCSASSPTTPLESSQ